MVRGASQLQLPADNMAAPTAGAPTQRRGINIGLGLPESSTEQVSGQGSASAAAKEAAVDLPNINPTRRTVLPNTSGLDRIRLTPSDPDTDMTDMDETN